MAWVCGGTGGTFPTGMVGKDRRAGEGGVSGLPAAASWHCYCSPDSGRNTLNEPGVLKTACAGRPEDGVGVSAVAEHDGSSLADRDAHTQDCFA